MREVKQYIIVRMDLGMSVGKIAAQASHAAKKTWFDKFNIFKNVSTYDDKEHTIEFGVTDEELQWIEGKFTTIVKKVKNEGQLLKAYNKAKELGLNVALIQDAGLTELEGKNNTVISIGPNYVDKCEPVVKRLQNLNIPLD
jgi:PTH2 family peptidyl-tRNA hydrolase